MVTEYGTYAYAGAIAEAWFRRMEDTFRKARTAECREIENEILDVALADAGVTPLDSELLPKNMPGQLHSMRV